MQNLRFSEKNNANKGLMLLCLPLLLLLHACKPSATAPAPVPMDAATLAQNQQAIGMMLDSFNVAAAQADADRYFGYFTEDATYLGTDATEHWDKKAFREWSKPYFERKKTWNFKAIERHVFFGAHADIAWFDELLATQMKICRGSGVVVKQGNAWKVQQYVLSMTIPNPVSDSVTAIKASIEDSLIQMLEHK